MRERGPDGIVRLTFMAHFHITAVFETKGESQAEAERVAAAAFPGLRHPRLHYYEHDTSGGLGPYPPSRSLYFTTIVELDAEAYTEEKAVELAEDILDRFSTDEIQYLGHGIIPGTPRVRPEDRKAEVAEDDRRATADGEEGADGQEEPRGKGRRSQRGRGRGRGRKSDRRDKDHDRGSEERERVADASQEPANEIVAAAASDTTPVVGEAAPVAPAPVRAPREAAPPPPPLEIEEPAPPPLPPRRSSSAMQVTLTVDLRASEVSSPYAYSSMADDELIALAITEARRRHAEIPVDTSPDSATSALPGGDRLISLTWRYEAPVPSAAELE
ncbi:MAG: hypothetical protein FJ147_08215 [Deltaproteobacteria bacterium]|nr:hypothetical protein [Deltaproteobacteria bacterium]